MLLQIVPEEVYKKRIRDKTKKSKGQGRGQLTEETKIRSRFTVFITNAEESQLSAEQAFLLYRLRWQIELHFKAWKSVFKIDVFHKMKKHRYFTLLYIKLLLIIINLQITCCLQQSFVQPEPNKIKILSLNKSLKTLETLFDAIFGMLRGTYRKAMEIAQYIRNRLLKNHWLESKKNKLCFPEILELIICKSKK
jgi:transposase